MTLIYELSNHYYVTGTTDTNELIARTIARIRELEAALREIAGNGNTPPASRKFKTADYRAGYVCGYLAQAEIAKAALTPLETEVKS